MAQTATRSSSNGSTKQATPSKKRAPAKSKAKSTAGSNGKHSEPSVKKAAAGAAAKKALTTRPGGQVRLKAAGAALKATAEAALDKVRDGGWENVRTVPIQCSLDVGAPLEAVYDEWMRFDWVPDGAHRVLDVERDGDSLFGRLAGPIATGDWEAEIVDEREDESMAWQTVEGSDTAGLVTFHRLADRLTRIELELDVIPTGMGDALLLVLRQADRRAEGVMRGFKAQVEALDPDEYPPVAELDDEADEDDADEAQDEDDVDEDE